jgi:MoaA/NifB/PqqE/SkfB family radical SAM enzyme
VEPLVVRNFKEVVTEASKRGIPVSVATNGLLVTKSMAQFLV